MEGCCFRSRCVFFNLFPGILLLCMSSGLGSTSAPTFANESDRLVLLDFKNLITQDPLQVMSSWNDSIHFCNWVGVSCSPSNERVVILNLQSQRLAGSMPLSIGNLTYLTGINLLNNSFHGELPQEMGRLRHLQHINLSYNSFDGKIPTNLTHCTDLRVLAVSRNHFTGEIPDQLRPLSKLVILWLGVNNLTGSIPPWIGNFSSLFSLSLAVNNFQGSIPNELGRLSGLGFFQVYGNYLSGTIPPSIYNISSIYLFSLAQNQLHGQLPPNVGLTLPRLETFDGGANNFTGPIPVSLSNASGLLELDFPQNSFTGTIPSNLASLQSLSRLNFDDNILGNGEIGDLNFLSSFANCTSLEGLGLARNRFGGELPSSIANLSIQLQGLTLGGNLIHGSIPTGIGNLVNLAKLGLEGNYLTGIVPDVIGKLQKLEGLNLNVNGFSGSIPSSLGNLTRLTWLFMGENRLDGPIPSSLGNCQNLQNLYLSSNNLNGTIPKQVIGLSSLSISLVMSHNFLTGSLPLEVGKLEQLMELDVSGNKLSGTIPSTLGNCISLERLHLEGNKFDGTIPESFQALKGMVELDFSRNNLSGKVPEFLSKLSSLKQLNVSYNDFDGDVPRDGVFSNASAISIIGNDKLCGGIPALLLPTCPRERQGKRFTHKMAILATVAVVFALLLCSLSILCMVRNSRRRRSSAPPSEEWQGALSYSELVQSTDGFAAENLIGSGSFGSVYRGVLPGDGRIVAIKVLDLQQQGASKSFINECNVLGSIRHRNLLKIITVCSTIDHQGNDFKCIVFEFMSSGSLDQWLHPRADEHYQTNRLSLIQRLNLAIDVASALDYLHSHCETTIVHCDLKPSNVLLDDDLTAHVGDFGLARFLFEASKNPSKNQAMSVGLKGSIGYVPPEYGQGDQVTVLGDIYSYGILLLEMFTGKRPTDDMFKDDLNIHNFVAMALPEHAMAIIDPSMLIEEENYDNEQNREDVEERAIIRDNDPRVNTRSQIEECLVSVMRVGLSCSARSPGERMAMNFAVNKLLAIRDSFLRSKNRSRKWKQ